MEFNRYAGIIALFVMTCYLALPETADARLPKRAASPAKKVAKSAAKTKVVKKKRSKNVVTNEASPAQQKPAAKVALLPVDAITSKESLESELGLLRDDEGFASMQKAALSLLGKRYQFGGNGRYGIDCSAFVRTVYDRLNIPLPRTAREQFYVGEQVAAGELRRGDLLFFRTYRQDASHVGIYVGNDRMIHASSGGKRVMISSINSDYYRGRYLGARRIVAENDDGIEPAKAPQRRTPNPLLLELERMQLASAN